MCKGSLKKYMLLKKEDGEEVSIYRVLELVEEKVLVTDCIKKTMPVWKNVEVLDAYVEVEENINTDTLSTLEDMDAEDRKIAYQRYNMISSILPFMANETMRIEAIKKVVKNKILLFGSNNRY